MRRFLFTAALLILLTIPVFAQRRGVSSPRIGASVAVRPSWGIAMRGGFGFVHNRGFGVFFNPRPFHHHRRFFFRPFPFASSFPFVNPYPIYPYYPLGYQSDFVYSNAAMQPAANYNPSQYAALASEVYRLQAEVDLLRQQQASQAERQQYGLNSPTETPRPIPVTRPRQEAPAPPAVLVYRDGRRVEVHNYAVAGQTLWIFSEERARKVPLADLDLEATCRATEERGLEFCVHLNTAPR